MSGEEIVLNTEKPLDIPKELWMMVDHLFRNAIKQVSECCAKGHILLFSFCLPV